MFGACFCCRAALERKVLGLPDIIPLDPEKMKEGNLGRGYVSEVKEYASRIENCDLTTTTCEEFDSSSCTKKYISGEEWIKGKMVRVRDFIVKTSLPRDTFERYGRYLDRSYHGSGHMRIAYACSSKKSDKVGNIMQSADASGRDPLFYGWHQHIEDLFQLYKDTNMGSYTKKDFELTGGLKVLEVKTILDKEALKTQNNIENILVTFAEKAIVGDKHHKYDRINHHNYKYQIKLANPQKSSKKVIVRIYLGLGKCLKYLE